MDERPIVTICEGKIQGVSSKSVLGPTYFSFKGIPFAQPPVGPLRFKEPQPPLKWEGVRDASKHAGKIAMQNLDFRDAPARVIGSEDCLYLNVYTRTLGGSRSVMFFVHGGGFVEGSANEYIYNQDYFMTTDVVLVSVNFRLGAMGFLNLGHEVASGNQGIRDIIMGLKWVQKNIKAFGGDPNNVTILGNSSGSMICHLFTLIPAVKGLFHKAILQSGSMFTAINYYEKNPLKNGFRLAKLLGIESEDPVKIVEALRSMPGDQIIKLEGQLMTKEDRIVNGFNEFLPECDGEYAKDPIIPVSFVEMLKNDADIPIIIGHTTDEGLLSFTGLFDNDEHFKFYDDHIEAIMRSILHLTDPSKFPEIMKEIREIYLKNQPITKENAWNLIRLVTDVFGINYNRKIIDMRNDHAKAPTYVYMFSHLGEQPTFYQYDHGPQPLKGVAHADELSYMFYLSYMRSEGEFGFPEEGTPDRLVVERFIKMWYNFAATGNPTPKTDDKVVTTTWKPSSKEKLYYLEINADKRLALKDDNELESRKFYNKIRDIFLV